MAVTTEDSKKIFNKGCTHLRLFNGNTVAWFPYLQSVKPEESTSSSTFKGDNVEPEISSTSTFKITVVVGAMDLSKLPWVTKGNYSASTGVFTRTDSASLPVLKMTYLVERDNHDEGALSGIDSKKYYCIRFFNVKATNCNFIEGSSGEVTGVTIEFTVSPSSNGTYDIVPVDSVDDAVASEFAEPSPLA